MPRIFGRVGKKRVWAQKTMTGQKSAVENGTVSLFYLFFVVSASSKAPANALRAQGGTGADAAERWTWNVRTPKGVRRPDRPVCRRLTVSGKIRLFWFALLFPLASYVLCRLLNVFRGQRGTLSAKCAGFVIPRPAFCRFFAYRWTVLSFKMVYDTYFNVTFGNIWTCPDELLLPSGLLFFYRHNLPDIFPVFGCALSWSFFRRYFGAKHRGICNSGGFVVRAVLIMAAKEFFDAKAKAFCNRALRG